MPRTVEELLAEALQLTVDEKEQLIHELHWSLLTPEERELTAEWTRRMAEIENGTAETVSLEEAIEDARQAVRDAGRRNAEQM